MKFIRGIVHSALIGTLVEQKLVHDLLLFDEDQGSYLHRPGPNMLYTGLIDHVLENLPKDYPVTIESTYPDPQLKLTNDDIPSDYIPFDNPEHRLRKYQITAARKALNKGRGVIEMATGSGKTEVMAVILKYLLDNGLAKKAYVITGTKFLMHQAASRLEARGLEGVSRLGAGHRFKESRIQVCVIDSVHRALQEDCRPEVINDFTQCDVVFFDESHHLSSKSWVTVGEHCPATWRFGLTATLWSDPFQFSHSDFYLIGLTGGLIVNVPSVVLRRKGFLADPLVTMLEVKYPPVKARKWDSIYDAGIVRHERRNSVVLSLARSFYESAFKTLIFVNRINHGLLLVKALTELGCKNVHFVKGGEKMHTWKPSGRWEVRKVKVEQLAELVNDEDQVVIVGNTVLDEGIDIPSFNVLIMATAMKKYRRTVQRAGRGMRPKSDDNRVYIFDFIDAYNNVLVKHSIYRMDTYKLEEFSFSPSLQNTCEVMGCPILLEDGLYHWEWLQQRTKRKRRKDGGA